jgi:hypothetical protein
LAVIPIYGYRKVECDKHKLEIDDESAAVVRRIFKMCTEGKNAAEIAKTLMSERQLNPSAYKYEKGIMKKPRPMKDPYLWNATTIHKILDAPEYLGMTINFKTWTKSYKDKKTRSTPEENRLVLENTHPAVIDEQTWSVVRKMRETKRRAPRYGEVGLFTGICRCADCGAKLYYLTRELHSKSGVRHEGAYSCSEYRKATQYQEPRKCTCHYVTETALADTIITHLRLLMKLTMDEKTFAKRLMEKSETEQTREIAANKKLIATKRRRVDELDTLFERLYEDRAIGMLAEERYLKMSVKYEHEQADLRAEIAVLEATVGEREGQLGNIDKFIACVREFTDLQTLTPAIVNSLIDKIVVYEPDKKRGKDRNQRIEIHYRFVGPFDALGEEVQTDGREEKFLFPQVKKPLKTAVNM